VYFGQIMVLVLVLGDAHVPQRAAGLPAKFRALLVPGKIQTILFTGNATSKGFKDYLKTLTSDVHMTRGDLDDISGASGGSGDASLPERKTVTIGNFKIGLTHGSQIVPWKDRESRAIVQREMDVDILITGHTHEFEAYEYNDKFFINPGSCTGAYSPLSETTYPSFVLMDVQQSHVVAYVYSYRDGAVQVEKMEHEKAKK
jgi:vacuolar protein sorting-associated protein 29